MKIPIKITPCPIVEAITEIRLKTNIPEEAVFGVIYNQFREEFNSTEKLPILQLPEAIRSNDPNLVYKPHYRLFKDDYIIQVGPRVFSFANVNEYVGWVNYSEKLNEILSKLYNLSIIEEAERLGLRYINFFADLNIYEKSMLKIQLKEKNLFKNDNNLTMLMKTGNFMSKLVMLNNAHVNLKKKDGLFKGSIIDIDVSIEKKLEYSNLSKLVEDAHIEEKKLFFNLLDPTFLKSFDPEY